MIIRKFEPGDEASLFQVFYSSVHLVACRDYSLEQINAWAPADFDVQRWSDRIQKIRPFVVEVDCQIAGYADLQTDGHIDHFFVSGLYPRQGIGRCLMARIFEEAALLELKVLSSNVSKTAEPFFSAFGFNVVERTSVMRRGISISNAVMRKIL